MAVKDPRVQKILAVEALGNTARALKRARLRQLHPNWTAAQIEAELRRIFARDD